ncbi:hypothetical protein Salat_1431000 [Sesamum alatum]|uniref:Uncharacterized protein n=1 Tax=Sesamum alatum TaxID=300844 RepID=A0AAE1YAH7_9LAMI|nr:hypothetical protein Salat_1431000 [Sesamum alatum]
MMNRAVVCKFISDDVPAMPSSSGMGNPGDRSCHFSGRCASMVPPSDFPQDVHPSSPLPSPVEDFPSSHKRPRVEVEGTEGAPTVAGPSEPVFLALVLTPRMDPQEGTFNMAKVVNQADVEVLTSRTFTGIGNLILSNASVILAVTAMVEKYSYALRNGEMLHREFQEAKATV